MSLLLLALALADLQPEAKTYTKAQLESLTSAELAREFLGPEVAMIFDEHRLLEDHHSWGNYHGIRFWSPPRNVGADLCVRDIDYVSLQVIPGSGRPPLVRVGQIGSNTKVKASAIALATDCSKVTHYAHVNFLQPELAADLLRFVTNLRDAAREGRRLPVPVECRAEFTNNGNPCANDLRTVIANLPVEKARLINQEFQSTGGGYSLALSQEPLPRPFWHVQLDDDPARARKVRVVWKIPAPF